MAGLTDRLGQGEVIIAAEGYLMELERRGYNKHGSFVPTVVLDNPKKVEELAREFVHAGSDICMAFTYHAHREKLSKIGRENECELLNRKAHEIAKKIAQETGTLFCSSFGTTNIYDPADPDVIVTCEKLYREQIKLSAEYEVDFVALETFRDYGEASIALKIAREFNLPAVVTINPVDCSGNLETYDGYKIADALRLLQKEGAACVGINCSRGPTTMIPVIKQLRNEIQGPMACLGIGYRTTDDQPTWFRLKHPVSGITSFPEELGAHYLSVGEVEWFGQQLKNIGIQYVGICCGNTGSYTRALAMQFGRNPLAAKYISDHKEMNAIVGKKVNNTTNGRNGSALAKFLYG